jgi:methylmalonyl-CoA/ethylmalonyl-CoA epimerase
MIGRLNPVAIAVKDMHAAAAVYRDILGAAAPEAVPQPEHGVSTIFVTLPNFAGRLSISNKGKRP